MNSRTRNWACCAWCTALGFSFGRKANITSAGSRRRTARIFVSPLLHNTAGACTVLLQYLALRVSLLLRVEPPKYIHTSTRRGLDLYFSQSALYKLAGRETEVKVLQWRVLLREGTTRLTRTQNGTDRLPSSMISTSQWGGGFVSSMGRRSACGHG